MTFARQKSQHYQNVEYFMQRAKQIPYVEHDDIHPRVPDEKIRLLRAKLIFEEAMETIDALGVQVLVPEPYDDGDHIPVNDPTNPDPDYDYEFEVVTDGNLIEIADGCADISVVTIGTLIACGIADVGLLNEVDESNIRKFAPGYAIREDGKLIKPPGWTPPDIKAVLLAQGAIPEQFA